MDIDDNAPDPSQLDALRRNVGTLEHFRRQVAADVIAARAAGLTWRAIAEAAGMTPNGVRGIYDRARAAG